MFCTVDKAGESWSAYFRWSTSIYRDRHMRFCAKKKWKSIQIDHKTVINTIKLKPNPRRPGVFRTGTVKERPDDYNAAGDRCYVGLKTSLARCRKSPSIFKKKKKNWGRGCLFMGQVEKDLNTLNPLYWKGVLSILFSILYTERKSWRILDNEWQNNRGFLFLCSDLKKTKQKLTAVFLICHWMLRR